MLITKQDLIDRTRISAQLSDRQVLPFIEDAETYDLPTLLSGNLIADMLAFNITALPWANETAYTAGAYAIYGNIYYKALQDTATSESPAAAPTNVVENTEDNTYTFTNAVMATNAVIPGADTTIWLPDYKATLRYLLLPDFLLWSAYKALILEHGVNITEAGLTTPADPENTYQQASDKRRGELLAVANKKISHHKGVVERFLVAHSLITRTSCAPNTARRSGRVAAI